MDENTKSGEHIFDEYIVKELINDLYESLDGFMFIDTNHRKKLV
ncbi:hypothetical protein [Roseburia sp. 499]|nr:hypothetical protein [Roseburia sp. 499]WVK70212.1 hypothetical protein BIV20_01405 [Roseburia sp. 499]